MNTNTSELLQLKKQYDEENELLQELEKNPISEGQLNDILGRGRSSVEYATLSKRLRPLLDELRERKLIVQDSPMSFGEFKKANPNMISIRASSLQQMELREYELFSGSFKRSNEQMVRGFDSRNWHGFKVYQDLPMDVIGQGFKSVQHYIYSENGREYESGTGFTARRPIVLVSYKNAIDGLQRISAEDRQKFNEAKKIYDRSRKEIDSIFKQLDLKVPDPLAHTV